MNNELMFINTQHVLHKWDFPFLLVSEQGSEHYHCKSGCVPGGEGLVPAETELSTLGRSWHACMHAQQCPTLCNPMDNSLPNCSVHRVLQVRTLEWVAIPYSSGHRDWTWVSSTMGRFFTIWATWEAQTFRSGALIPMELVDWMWENGRW